MADMRDRLIELLESARYWGCGTSTEIADHLLANGVITHEWISVEDRLPEKSGKFLVTGRPFREKTYQVWICDFLSCEILRGWSNAARNPIVEAWMPLPEPPKALREKEK